MTPRNLSDYSRCHLSEVIRAKCERREETGRFPWREVNLITPVLRHPSFFVPWTRNQTKRGLAGLESWKSIVIGLSFWRLDGRYYVQELVVSVLTRARLHDDGILGTETRNRRWGKPNMEAIFMPSSRRTSKEKWQWSLPFLWPAHE